MIGFGTCFVIQKNVFLHIKTTHCIGCMNISVYNLRLINVALTLDIVTVRLSRRLKYKTCGLVQYMLLKLFIIFLSNNVLLN